jgi:hypothetical protein
MVMFVPATSVLNLLPSKVSTWGSRQALQLPVHLHCLVTVGATVGWLKGWRGVGAAVGCLKGSVGAGVEGAEVGDLD